MPMLPHHEELMQRIGRDLLDSYDEAFELDMEDREFAANLPSQTDTTSTAEPRRVAASVPPTSSTSCACGVPWTKRKHASTTCSRNSNTARSHAPWWCCPSA